MHRPISATAPFRHRPHTLRWQESLARLLVPLTLWICVSVTIRYGYFADCRMVLGPSSSRLFEASSVFVRQVEVRDDDKKGVLLYGFFQKPELSLETNWSVSDYHLIVAAYGRKGFSLWLNKGSRIHMRWEAQTSTLDQLQVSLTKGERNQETVKPTSTSSMVARALYEPTDGKEAEYNIEEDDKYDIGITNTNPRSIIMAMSMNVTSKMHDTTKAKSVCSTTDGSCRLNLLFPGSQYVVVATPNHGDLAGWYVELSFVARLISYIGILGFVVIVISIILRYLGACDAEAREDQAPPARNATEADPLMPEKPFMLRYGTGEEDEDSGSSSSSEDLYDGKICVICYDMPRNCFFVPCGHCATCHDCAQRIMGGETKVCPICRRLIHKVRKLIIP